MKIPEMFAEIRYLGRAEGDRRTYYVFESTVGYLVLTPGSDHSFNVNTVDLEAPEVLSRKFKGKQLTTGRLKLSSRRPDLFGDSFACLNALYVMVALGRAKKLKRREGRAMVFKVR